MDEVITMLDELLDNSKEEILQQYLEQHKKILIAAFGQPEWVYNFVLPKFKFGSDYISDFVVFTGQSYSYWIKLIELEPSTSQVFTKQGDYAQRLNQTGDYTFEVSASGYKKEYFNVYVSGGY